MHEAPVRFSSEHVSARSARYWRDSRFRAPERSTRPRVRRTQRYLMYAGLLVGFCILLAFAGCGSNSPTGNLRATQTAVNFGAVAVGHMGTATVSFTNSGTGSVQISQVNITGQPFQLAGKITFPVNIAAGGTWSFQVAFKPSGAGEDDGELTLTGNATSQMPDVSLSGLGVQAIGEPGPASSATLSGISCNNSSLTGAGGDSCFVALSAEAGSPLTVSLSSSSSAIAVPNSVTVPANTTGIGFTATASAVPSAQTAVLTASAGGVSESVALQLNPALRVLSASTSSLGFGYVDVNSSATESVVLTSAGTEAVSIQAISVTGGGFSAPGASVPLSLNPGQALVLNVQFDPGTAGPASGNLTITSNDSAGSTMTIALSGTGAASGGSGGGSTALNALSCASGSLTGSGTDTCTVTLTSPATSGGMAVILASNNAAVTVPASVTVPSGTASTQFAATAAAVASAQTAILTASAGGASQAFTLQLKASGAFLSANSASVAFGNVSLNLLATQTLILSSTGTQAVTISAVTLAGVGFTVTGATLPVTLNPGQSLTLNLGFLPTVTGAVTGQLTVTSNATSGAPLVIALSADGAIPYQVDLTWLPPATSTDPVVGYNVYRAAGGAAYQMLNTAVNLTTTYVDTTPQDGQSYEYYVTSVDSSGIESAPSNIFNTTIP